MRCPDEIADVVLPPVTYGLLRARAAAWQGKADLCAIESDHIHNLPDLLADYTPDKLSYYWNVERPSYLEQIGLDQSAGWEQLWHLLSGRIDQPHSVASHP